MRTLVLISSILLSANVGAAERIVRESIPANANVRFSIDLHRAEVEITTGSVDTIELTAYIEHPDQAEADKVEIDIDQLPTDVKVEVIYDDPDNRVDFDFIGLRKYVYPEIRFVIVLPDAASLNVEAHRSRFDISAPSGRVDIDTTRSTGRLREVRNDLAISTQRGDFDVEIMELHDVEVEAQRSDVRLDIFGATDFTLIGETHRGDARFSGQDISKRERDRGVSVNQVVGTGENFMTFDVQRGNININFRN
ncbi:MAG: hypothetical protein Q8L60_14590 [Gammaproteobacteria bacterium]|nr:hypothetical protein [Gammaproteobacteria bacterium]MDP2346600.1 hypothetical protein [Gammaproteobacteria bacterium]